MPSEWQRYPIREHCSTHPGNLFQSSHLQPLLHRVLHHIHGTLAVLLRHPGQIIRALSNNVMLVLAEMRIGEAWITSAAADAQHQHHQAADADEEHDQQHPTAHTPSSTMMPMRSGLVLELPGAMLRLAIIDDPDAVRIPCDLLLSLQLGKRSPAAFLGEIGVVNGMGRHTAVTSCIACLGALMPLVEALGTLGAGPAWRAMRSRMAKLALETGLALAGPISAAVPGDTVSRRARITVR